MLQVVVSGSPTSSYREMLRSGSLWIRSTRITVLKAELKSINSILPQVLLMLRWVNSKNNPNNNNNKKIITVTK